MVRGFLNPFYNNTVGFEVLGFDGQSVCAALVRMARILVDKNFLIMMRDFQPGFSGCFGL